MLRGTGSPLIEICDWRFVSWFLGFWFFVFFSQVSFFGFKVYWFQSFVASWFQRFKISRIPYYQKSVSCFLEDLDPHIPDFQNPIRRIIGSFGPPFFPTTSIFGFPKHDICKMIFSESELGVSCFVLRYPGVSKNKIKWFWGSGTRPGLLKS